MSQRNVTPEDLGLAPKTDQDHLNELDAESREAALEYMGASIRAFALEALKAGALPGPDSDAGKAMIRALDRGSRGLARTRIWGKTPEPQPRR